MLSVLPRVSLTALLAAAMLASPLPTLAAEDAGFPSAEQRAAEFANLCQFVEEEYAYFDARKTDWPKACAFYAAQTAEATDRNAYVSLLERALGELYDAHAHLGTNTPQSPRLVPTQSSLFGAWRGGKALIVAVKPGSAAEQAGLRPGTEVLTVDAEPIEAAVNRIEPKFLSQPDPVARDWALQIALAGHRDRQTVRLEARVDGAARTFEYLAEAPQPGTLLSHRSVGRVGHVRIHNSLGDPALVQAFDAALAAMPDARALVLDLRDTPSGGTSSVARGLMGRFVRRPMPYQRHELVSEFRSHGVRRLWVEYVAPRGTPFLPPVVVLVGHWTGSMGEGIAIGLNAARGARVVGQPMAHLLGALGETVLPHSKIPVRVPTEKLFHVDGRAREAFVPRAIVASGGASSADPELEAAIAEALEAGSR
ncbi:MAG: S41 family peptidase [Burkholderiaceae bacterium]